MTWDNIWMYFVIGAYFCFGFHAIFVYCNHDQPRLMAIQIAKANPGQVAFVLLVFCFVIGLFFSHFTSKLCTSRIFLLGTDSDAAFKVSFHLEDGCFVPGDFLVRNPDVTQLFETIPGYNRQRGRFDIAEVIDNQVVKEYLSPGMKQEVLKSLLLKALDGVIIEASLTITQYDALFRKNESTKQLTTMCRALSVISLLHIVGFTLFLVVSLVFRFAFRSGNQVFFALVPVEILNFVKSRYYWTRLMLRVLVLGCLTVLMYYASTSVANSTMERFMLQLLQAGAVPPPA